MELLFNGALLHWNYSLTILIMKNTLAWIAFIVATAFATISLFLPPQGKIDASVLMWCAQLLILCATFLGVESYVNFIRGMK